jgi:GrpB-like predicted nucleotidyltransferase (UPF0157 family)
VVVKGVSIVAARPEWSQEYETVADELSGLAGDSILGVFHVGSTSVPGLAAKDVIDVQVSVAAESLIDRTLKALDDGGFAVRRDIRRDHAVPGEPEDDASWMKGFANERPGERRANIHVRVAGRANHRYALLFRDYLRAHPETATAYAAFKLKAAVLLAHDSVTYSDLKDPVCDLVYLPARQWAVETGWHAPPLIMGHKGGR